MNLYDSLKTFVTNFCEGRDESHGMLHMKLVADRSIEICNELKSDQWTRDAVCIVAWLHDVLDHKYFVSEKQKENVKNFIISLKWNPNDVLSATEAVSFSKEKKYGMRYFEKILEKKWIVVRDIVSDADKEDAIGINGVNRCYIYEKHINPKATDDELTQIVKGYVINKLLKLYPDNFFVTIPGNKRAKILQKEMIDWYNSH